MISKFYSKYRMLYKYLLSHYQERISRGLKISRCLIHWFLGYLTPHIFTGANQYKQAGTNMGTNPNSLITFPLDRVCIFFSNQILVTNKLRFDSLHRSAPCTTWTHSGHKQGTINSLKLSGAYMRRQTLTSLVLIMACRLLGTKPLSEPMLVYCYLEPSNTHFSEIGIEILTFPFKKIQLKMSSANWRPFCLASMC